MPATDLITLTFGEHGCVLARLFYYLKHSFLHASRFIANIDLSGWPPLSFAFH